MAGALVRGEGGEYYNPDEATRIMLLDDPLLEPETANSLAWLEGKRLLEKAISDSLNFTLETSLGGNTIPALLRLAAGSGLALRIWFVALGSAEDHIARVKARVKHGGHDIPEVKIYQRYDTSRANLIQLLPYLAELRLFDNSAEGDPAEDAQPRPVLILHLLDSRIAYLCPLPEVPQWAKPIVVQAIKLFGPR